MLRRMHLSSVRKFHSTISINNNNWYKSDEIKDKKSVFIARAKKVDTPEEAKSDIEELKASNKKIAKATHNITAWRILSNGNVQQASDDDGEAAAGGRLLRLLELLDCKNIVVCVTRWYGGIQLGPARFKHISTCARNALEKGSFVRFKK